MAYVEANEGYKSAKMDVVTAFLYAAALEKLGNYNVKVVLV
ncbi:hypothetical protein [Gorillibacterium sp. sgz5001074]